MALSLMAGERVTLSRVDAFADGVAVKQVGAGSFALRQGRVQVLPQVSPVAARGRH